MAFEDNSTGRSASPVTASLHRITECSGLEGTSVGHPVQSPAEAGSSTVGCTGPHPGGS